MSLKSYKGPFFYKSNHHNEFQQTSVVTLIRGVSSWGIFHNTTHQPICRIWVISNSIPLSALTLWAVLTWIPTWEESWEFTGLWGGERWEEEVRRNCLLVTDMGRLGGELSRPFFSIDNRTFPQNEWWAQRWDRSAFGELVLVDCWQIWGLGITAHTRFRKHEFQSNHHHSLAVCSWANNSTSHSPLL